MKPIHDKAAVALNFPDKVYMGAFGRDSKFEATVEDDGLRLKLVRPGEEKRVFELHIHHYLLADIIAQWAESVTAAPAMSKDHRDDLIEALKAAEKAVRHR
ncbi:MAG: hypothetical protein HOH66_18235 [Rhodospirillaceae bacterium]|jgi:hypothetical protein|nr:hypothetical protein [Rhodospirillaceae bacterium]